MARINYSKNRYCRGCRLEYPLNKTHCNECGHFLATKPISKKNKKISGERQIEKTIPIQISQAAQIMDAPKMISTALDYYHHFETIKELNRIRDKLPF